MWSHLIKLVSLSKGALIVGVAASAAMVSNAEFSTAPSHNELPSATPTAIVSTAPATAPAVEPVKPTERPVTTEPKPEPKTEPKTQDSASPSTSLEGLIKECVTKYTALRAAGDNASQGDRESTSAVCKAAIEQSGLTSAEFAAKYGLLTTTATPKPTTAAPTNGDLSPEALAWAKECVTKYTLHSADASATCIKAIQLSGLTSSAFAARFLNFRTTEPTPTPKTTPLPSPTVKPSTTPAPVSAADLAQLVTKCLDLYKAMATTGDTHAVSEACGAAIRASGMTSSDFWAKYHPATN